jgi:hypothetical protein
MGKTPKMFTQVSPDPVLEEAIKDKMQGATAPARLAHVNKVLEALSMPSYAGQAAAKTAGLVEGDFFRLSGSIHGEICVVF